MQKEYKTISEIAGPLVFVEKTYQAPLLLATQNRGPQKRGLVSKEKMAPV